MPELQKRGICDGMHRTGTLKKGRKESALEEITLVFDERLKFLLKDKTI
ncbi:hypothetical protein QJN88_00555 [Escherichia coli]|nr:hypothetical protein [Escherichia coli]EHW3220308.1 hypothetical protein [Escherichia coli]EHX8085091.1 hypothetical protein [Escherichia coli]HAW7815599.1 hypothetical protein [Escherichia coli]